MKEIGADERNLIGTRDQPSISLCMKFYSTAYWRLLARNGWTVDDFKKLGIYDELAKISENFRAIFPAVRVTYETTDMSQVLGDKQTCSICKEPFQKDDGVEILSCKHIFHKACLAKIELKECPYCRSFVSH